MTEAMTPAMTGAITARLPDLPIDAVLDELRAALRAGHVLLQAPTGSGKSTGVPLALLDEPWLAQPGILMLEPRRAAARLTAARLAARLGEPLGEQVGYRIRFERRLSARTRIEVVTEGILTRRLQSDPELSGVGLLIFDEFHERNLHADLGLALALDAVAGLRPDLRILVMSATLDIEPLVARLSPARLVRGSGRSFPVEIRYPEVAPPADPVAAAGAAIRSALAGERGDLLVFLPGAREIQGCLNLLAPLAEGGGVRLLPLHGSLPSAEQDAALLPPPAGAAARPRRVVLATDIAETSLTIEGIRVVIDTGLTRKPRFDPGSGLTRLVTQSIPLASADQRTGRAGRLEPGVCFRLWTRAQEQGRPAHRTPEILTSDLAALALELALWGVADPGALTWLDPPPAAAWQQAVALLIELGALDARGRISALGRALAELPVHPRLAAMFLGAAPAARPLAADLCALLTEPDPWPARPGLPRPADLELRLHALADWRARRAPVGSGAGAGSEHATAGPRAHRHGSVGSGSGAGAGPEPRRLAAIDRVARQLTQSIRTEPPTDGAAGAATPGALLALAYPERIAQRRASDDRRYRLASGGGAILPPDDALAIHPWLVVATLDAAGRDGRIQLALPIAEAELRQIHAERIRTGRELTWDAGRESVAAREVQTLGALRLAERPVAPEDPAAVVRLLLEAIAQDFERALHWTESARQLQARVRLLRRLEPEAGWPDLDDGTLRATLDDWLAPWLAGRSRLAEVRQLDLTALLMARLDWDRQQRLEAAAPRGFRTPAGNTRPIDYASQDPPVLAVPLQELFGLAETPSVGDGRVPLLLHLLSPARRPIQVTQDLAGFWARGYAEVRRELRGRYPKHRWPEDPTQAAPAVGGLGRRRD